MRIRRICVLGGTGFVGKHLCAELSRRRLAIRVLTRNRERRRDLLVIPTLELVEADVHSVSDLSVKFKGCDAVVNLVGILNERRGTGASFASAHAELPSKVAEACRYNRIGRLLHMSALNAAPEALSEYLKTKAAGESAVHAWERECLAVTSFQPSVIFGPDDDFFNRFARLLAFSPYFFPLACPDARFAPVFVGDVVAAMAASLEDKATFGRRYELCGPQIYTLKELVELTARAAGLRRRVIGLNDRLSRLQARILEHVPGKPFSMDNYLSTKTDSVCEHNSLAEFGIHPTSVESVVPLYLGHLDREGRFSRYRSARGP